MFDPPVITNGQFIRWVSGSVKKHLRPLYCRCSQRIMDLFRQISHKYATCMFLAHLIKGFCHLWFHFWKGDQHHIWEISLHTFILLATVKRHLSLHTLESLRMDNVWKKKFLAIWTQGFGPTYSLLSMRNIELHLPVVALYKGTHMEYPYEGCHLSCTIEMAPSKVGLYKKGAHKPTLCVDEG